MVLKNAHSSWSRAGLFVVALTSVACDVEGPTDAPASTDETPADDPSRAPARVRVRRARPLTEPLTVRTLAEIRAATEHTISVGAPGRVRAVRVAVGDRVAAGAVVLTLDPRREGLALDRARAARRRAAVDLARAERALTRIEQLHRDGIASIESLEQAQAQVDLAVTADDDARAAGRLARHDLAEGTVRAPAAGIITDRRVEPGQQVVPGRPLVTLDTEALEVVTWVSERDVDGIAIGDAATVFGRSHESAWPAAVSEIARRADGRTGNFSVVLTLDGNPRARPGTTAEVELNVRARGRRTVSIPEAALTTRQRRLAAFVVDDGVARRVFPRVGPPRGGIVPVYAGIEVGQSIVVEGTEVVRDGMAVETQR